MQVINRFRLHDFYQEHDGAENQLRAWYQFVCACEWESQDQLKETFINLPDSGDQTVFDIRGSTYFVCTTIDYPSRIIYVRDVLLHSDYRKRDGTASAQPSEDGTEPDTADSPTTYRDLLETFEPRPIHDSESLRNAAAMIDQLLDKPEPTDDERDYLHLLTLLVRDYEDQHIPIPPVPGAEILRYLIMEHRLSQVELIPMLGRKAHVADLLRGDNRLNLRQIARASRYFKVDGEVFFDPDDFDPAAWRARAERATPRRVRASH
jgi:HTH-type transcriptional regulator / antitoxin HigA